MKTRRRPFTIDCYLDCQCGLSRNTLCCQSRAVLAMLVLLLSPQINTREIGILSSIVSLYTRTSRNLAYSKLKLTRNIVITYLV